MPSIPISELLTIIFVMVDNWYQVEGRKVLTGKVGKKPIFRDSEVIKLVLAQDFIPYPAETQYLEFIRANYLALFPKLLDQSQFNRRARALQRMIEELRRYWITQKAGTCTLTICWTPSQYPCLVTIAIKTAVILQDMPIMENVLVGT